MKYMIVIGSIVLVASCWIFGDTIDLGNGWVAGTDGVGKTWLTKEKYIPEKDTTVILGITSASAGFDVDEQFIVAGQGMTTYLDAENRIYEAYWIIEKQTDIVHGPMSKDSFELLREAIGVPASLEIRSPYDR